MADNVRLGVTKAAVAVEGTVDVELLTECPPGERRRTGEVVSIGSNLAVPAGHLVVLNQFQGAERICAAADFLFVDPAPLAPVDVPAADDVAAAPAETETPGATEGA